MNLSPIGFTQRYPRLAELIGIDLRSLALLRVLVGLVLFATLASAACDLDAFFGDSGVLPRATLIDSDGRWRLSLHLVNGQAWFIAALLAIQLGAALMLALGWRTRLASLLSFLLWVSLVNRNPLLADQGDTLLGALLFWMMLLPLGARYSFDAALASTPPPRDKLLVSWASLGLLVQLACVFFFAAILQSGREWLPDFSAGYYLLMPERQALFTARWLLGVPVLLQSLTVAAWITQWLAPLLLFTPYGLRPLRLVGLVLLTLLSLGALLSLRLGLLPWLALAGLSVFIGSWIWDALARRRAPLPNLHLYYDRDCAFCQRSAVLLRELLLLPELQVTPAQDQPRARALLEANRSWVVIDIDEQAHLKWPALVVLLRRSPLFAPLWPLLRAPSLVAPGNAVYDFIARHRGRLTPAAASQLACREISPCMQRVAAAALVLIVALNLQSVRLLPAFTAAPLQALGRTLGLEQRWDRFAPSPRKDDGWWVIPARLENGREIDLRDAAHRAPDYSRASARSAENRRWRNLDTSLWTRNDPRLYAAYAETLCREWNSHAHKAGERLMTFKMVYMLERTPPPGSATQVEQIIAARHECFPAETHGQIP